ncbi:MAG: hypothetical protein HY674_05580, partial [Chloroflexi bacterium]|nr:hypothetical protein [Chloroflexota bacterium]
MTKKVLLLVVVGSFLRAEAAVSEGLLVSAELNSMTNPSALLLAVQNTGLATWSAWWGDPSWLARIGTFSWAPEFTINYASYDT